MCCAAVSQLRILAKSIISSANRTQEEDAADDLLNINLPEHSVEKARIIRSKVQVMTGYLKAVSNSFITGISDVAEACLAAIKGAFVDTHEVIPQTAIQRKANTFTEHLGSDQCKVVGKIQDGLRYLSYLVLSTSTRST